MPGAAISPSSPLDPVLIPFLRLIEETTTGFLPGSQSKEFAVSLDIPDALIDALFVSARTRNLIKPDYSSRRGRRTPWILSDPGQEFLAMHPAGHAREGTPSDT